jgi:hypothetical protein
MDFYTTYKKESFFVSFEVFNKNIIAPWEGNILVIDGHVSLRGDCFDEGLDFPEGEHSIEDLKEMIILFETEILPNCKKLLKP